MGDLDAFDGSNTLVIIGPPNYLYLANDHVTVFRFTPASVMHTDVRRTWLAREGAQGDATFDLEFSGPYQRLDLIWPR